MQPNFQLPTLKNKIFAVILISYLEFGPRYRRPRIGEGGRVGDLVEGGRGAPARRWRVPIGCVPKPSRMLCRSFCGYVYEMYVNLFTALSCPKISGFHGESRERSCTVSLRGLKFISVCHWHSRKKTATIRAEVHTNLGPPALRRALLPAFDMLDGADDFTHQNAYLPYYSVFSFFFINKNTSKKCVPELKYHPAMVISAKIFQDFLEMNSPKSI